METIRFVFRVHIFFLIIKILTTVFLEKNARLYLIKYTTHNLYKNLFWRNNRSGDARVAKRIDHFLVAEQLVDRFIHVRQWVGSGGLSDHFPIFFEIQKGPTNPPIFLKFNKVWLQDETFKNIFHTNWIPFDGDLDRSTSFQFANNIKKMKRVIKEWSIAKRCREDAELKQVEEELLRIYEGDGGGSDFTRF